MHRAPAPTARAMPHPSIECRAPSGARASEAWPDEVSFGCAVRRLLERHALRGHVAEPHHGAVRVRDRAGNPVATYWFIA